MATPVRLKRSSVPGKIPTVGDIALGEVAINTYDGKMFIKKDDGAESIVELGTGGGGGSQSIPLWDITPTIDTTILTASVIDSVDMIVDGQTGELVFDVVGAGPSPGHGSAGFGVAKTDLVTDFITASKTFRFGWELTTAPNGAVYQVGMMLAPASYSATALRDAYTGAGVGGISAFIADTAFGQNQQTTLDTSIADNSFPYPGGGSQIYHNISTQNLAVELGRKTLLVVGRTTNELSFAAVSVSPDNTQHDIVTTNIYTDGPVNPELAVFYIVVTLDVGSGYEPIGITPQLTLDAPSYAVSGTTAGTAGLTQPNWDNYFPGQPIQPSIVVVTHAVFPPNVAQGMLLKTWLDPLYTSLFIPMPYGHAVGDKAIVYIDSVTGTPSFTLYMDEEAVSAALLNTQQTIEQNVNAVISGVTTLTQRAQQSTSEVVVYCHTVSPQQALPASASFATFDAAYEYLITLPPSLKKRLVLDDRGFTGQYGELSLTRANLGYITPNKVYALFANNITLSTYRAYTHPVTSHSSFQWGVGLSHFWFDCKVDGLMLDSFVGELRYNADDFSPMVNIGATVAATWAGGDVVSDCLRVHANCSIFFNNGVNADSGGRIRIGHDNYIVAEFQRNSLDPMTSAVVIDIADNSAIELGSGNPSGLLLPRTDPSLPCIEVNYYEDLANVKYDSSGAVSAGYQNYVQLNPLYGTLKRLYPNAKLVRRLSDFSTNLVDTNTWLVEPGKYLVVGDVNLGIEMLRCNFVSGQRVEIMGLPNAVIRSTSGTIISTPLGAILTLRDLTLSADGSSPAVINTGSQAYTRLENLVFDTTDPLDLAGGAGIIAKNIVCNTITNPIRMASYGDVIVDGVQGTANDTAFMSVYMDDPEGRLTLSNMDVRYTGVSPPAGVIDFDTIYTSNDNIPARKLRLRNVSVYPGDTYTPLPAKMFSIAGAAYDHLSDHSVDVENECFLTEYHDVNDITVTISTANTLVDMTSASAQTHGKGFTRAGAYIRSNTMEIFRRRYEVSLYAEVSIPAGVATGIIHLDFGGGQVFDVSVYCADTLVKYPVTFSRYVTLDPNGQFNVQGTIVEITGVLTLSNFRLAVRQLP
jgi:hypothetical protein